MELRREPGHDHYVVCLAYELATGTMFRDENHVFNRAPAVSVDGVIDYFMPGWLQKR